MKKFIAATIAASALSLAGCSSSPLAPVESPSPAAVVITQTTPTPTASAPALADRDTSNDKKSPAPAPSPTKTAKAKPRATASAQPRQTPAPKPKPTAKPKPETPHIVKIEEVRWDGPPRFGDKTLLREVGGECVRVDQWHEELGYETTKTTGIYVRHEEERIDTVARYSDGHSEIISTRWEPGRAYESRATINRGGQPCNP